MLGKRQMTSEAPLPSAAKQARQESPGNKPHATSPGVKAAAFLTSCAFCGKGLGPGMDTYIYRYIYISAAGSRVDISLFSTYLSMFMSSSLRIRSVRSAAFVFHTNRMNYFSVCCD
jgi:hypothetical protein